MKKLFVITLGIGLIFCCAGAAGGAVHPLNGDFTSWNIGEFALAGSEPSLGTGNAADTWYSIAPNQNVIKGNLASADETVVANLDYILNDQTFAGFATIDFFDAINFFELRGSYLFDFGLFVGLDYISSDPDSGTEYTFYTIAPGYRFDLNDQAYLAISIDYTIDDADFSDVSGYDLDFAYYGDTAKIYAQYYVASQEWVDDMSAYNLGGAYQLAEELVIGFNYFSVEDLSDYDAGLTWAPDFMTLDLQFGTFAEEGFYAISGIYNISESIGVGLEVFNLESNDENRVMFKFKYQSDNSKLIFGYVFEGDYYSSAAYDLYFEYHFE